MQPQDVILRPWTVPRRIGAFERDIQVGAVQRRNQNHRGQRSIRKEEVEYQHDCIPQKLGQSDKLYFPSNHSGVTMKPLHSGLVMIGEHELKKFPIAGELTVRHISD
jgi:hypothetical protein